MSLNGKFERSLFGFDEYESIRATHHPEIYDLTNAELRDIGRRLRQMREKERTLARQKRREVRGKAEPRGGNFPGTAERPQLRKRAVSAALKRVNKEIKRQQKLEAKAANVEAARRALAMRRAANFVHYPAVGSTSHEGMQPIINRKRRWSVPPAKIGSISQATKVQQAVRDSKS